MRSEIIRPELRAARIWISRTPTVEIGEAFIALLVEGPPTATEASIAPAVAAWLCDRFNLPMTAEEEIDELRARIAALEKLVPAAVMLELPVLDAEQFRRVAKDSVISVAGRAAAPTPLEDEPRTGCSARLKSQSPEAPLRGPSEMPPELPVSPGAAP